jgi:hypothetical protein
VLAKLQDSAPSIDGEWGQAFPSGTDSESKLLWGRKVPVNLFVPGNHLIDFPEFLSLLAIRCQHRHSGHEVLAAFMVRGKIVELEAQAQWNLNEA